MRLFPSAGCDWLVVGLGNPGGEYQNTRHNAGFMAVDRIADALGVRITKIKYKALCATATYRGQKLLLLKPETFMNASGLAVEAAAHFIRSRRSACSSCLTTSRSPSARSASASPAPPGGHNGIKSIIAMLHSEDFPRVKIGVGAKPHPDYDLADWVLSSFSKAEQPELDRALGNARDAALCVITDGCEKAAASFNGK